MASCGSGQPDPDVAAKIERMKPKWTELKDGSRFATTGSDMDDSSGAIRCWPQGRMFHCLRVGRLNSIGAYSISLSSEAALPDFVFAGGGDSEGYGCGTAIGAREEISSGGKTLDSNQPGYGTPRWSAGHVRKFMAENDVKGQPWYHCLEILDAVLGNDMAAIGTTKVTRAMID